MISIFYLFFFTNSFILIFVQQQQKHYWEVEIVSTSSRYIDIGVVEEGANLESWIGGDDKGWSWQGDGNLWQNRNSTSYTQFGQGDIVGVHLDMDSGELSFSCNRETRGLAFSGLSGRTLYPAIALYNTGYSLSFFSFLYSFMYSFLYSFLLLSPLPQKKFYLVEIVFYCVVHLLQQIHNLHQDHNMDSSFPFILSTLTKEKKSL